MKKAILAVLAVVLLASVLFGCVTEQTKRENERKEMLASIDYKEIPFDQLKSAIASVTTDGQGFIVTAYVLHPDWMYFSIGDKKPENLIISAGGFSMSLGSEIPGGISLGAQRFDGKYPDIYKQLEKDRQYTVYIACLKEDRYGNSSDTYNGIITEIDGLRSIAEVTAAREAQQEAARLAKEEANKYDPEKFTVVPADFKPADYEKIDLFEAVAKVEKMPRGNAGTLDVVLNVYEFVSDVVFVGQNGTDIQFNTSDGAISQTMKINARSGLTSGQNVRIYYKVGKNPLTEWNIIAIERL
jgi:outer membrane lipoprotein-sorting protein